MRGHAFLIGQYLPGTSWLHRTPYLLKLLAVAVVGILCTLIPLWLPAGWLRLAVQLALVLAVIVAYPSTGLPRLALWGPIRLLWPAVVLVTVYQLLTAALGGGSLSDAGFTAASFTLILFSCVYTAALLSLTTPVQEVLDGLGLLCRPLRVLGADPERFALTVSLMFRSIPYLLGAYADVHDAARARGLERSFRAHALPTAMATVALATATGEALAARGLGD
ncbi:energy-coupling factor transporter transmembrane component T family protein [Psychromicrobium xiongbiense]|uniref:energy-coupling factor transporter transmembrane component T family protein n=1 Tax=Psychromicrobium xiongbiense TaxID=3051184 RepID=UPI002552C9EF|nr:energy-coupling factor transporter transmembrane protein EcfT [Psychromicrobium sp. YIM S02556]